LDFSVSDEGGGAAEAAVLPDALGIEHRDRLAALALDGPLLGEPASRLVRQLPQRLGEIVLDECAGGRIDDERRDRAAEGAHERLLRRVPLGLGAAGRAGMLLERGDIRHRIDRRAYFARYSSSALRLIRYVEPIFFAWSSPDSMIVWTSASLTP